MEYMNAVEFRTQLYPRRHIEMTPSFSLYSLWLHRKKKKKRKVKEKQTNKLLFGKIFVLKRVQESEWNHGRTDAHAHKHEHDHDNDDDDPREN